MVGHLLLPSQKKKKKHTKSAPCAPRSEPPNFHQASHSKFGRQRPPRRLAHGDHRGAFDAPGREFRVIRLERKAEDGGRAIKSDRFAARALRLLRIITGFGMGFKGNLKGKPPVLEVTTQKVTAL